MPRFESAWTKSGIAPIALSLFSSCADSAPQSEIVILDGLKVRHNFRPVAMNVPGDNIPTERFYTGLITTGGRFPSILTQVTRTRWRSPGMSPPVMNGTFILFRTGGISSSRPTGACWWRDGRWLRSLLIQLPEPYAGMTITDAAHGCLYGITLAGDPEEEISMPVRIKRP